MVCPDISWTQPRTRRLGRGRALAAGRHWDGTAWDAVAAGDYVTAINDYAEDIVVDNGPGAGPFRHVEGRDAYIAAAFEFIPLFDAVTCRSNPTPGRLARSAYRPPGEAARTS